MQSNGRPKRKRKVVPASAVKSPPEPKRDQMNLDLKGFPGIRDAVETTADGFGRSATWVVAELVRAFLIESKDVGLAALARASLPPELAENFPIPARARG